MSEAGRWATITCLFLSCLCIIYQSVVYEPVGCSATRLDRTKSLASCNYPRVSCDTLECVIRFTACLRL